MDKDILLHQLEDLAEKLGIEIRYESIETENAFSPGGLCRVEDRYFLIINRDVSQQAKIQTLGRALVKFDLSNLYLRPWLRGFLSDLQD